MGLISGAYAFGARLLFRLLLLPEPGLSMSPEKRAAFEALAARLLAARGATMAWDVPYDVHEFTRYLVREHPVLLHGSPSELAALEPSRQTDFSGAPVTAVFATDDGIWPLFFAILHRSKAAGPYSLRNAAMVVGDGTASRRYYLFSTDRENHRQAPFGAGFIHILPRETFKPTSSKTVRFPEWVSETPVAPVARFRVNDSDFPFRGRISAHRRGEWFPITWLLYRYRTR